MRRIVVMAKMLSTAPRLPYININTSLPVNVIQIPPVPCCCYLRSQGCIRYSTVSFHLFFLVIYFLYTIRSTIPRQTITKPWNSARVAAILCAKHYLSSLAKKVWGPQNWNAKHVSTIDIGLYIHTYIKEIYKLPTKNA